jgi:hypothetical protein
LKFWHIKNSNLTEIGCERERQSLLTRMTQWLELNLSTFMNSPNDLGCSMPAEKPHSVEESLNLVTHGRGFAKYNTNANHNHTSCYKCVLRTRSRFPLPTLYWPQGCLGWYNYIGLAVAQANSKAAEQSQKNPLLRSHRHIPFHQLQASMSMDGSWRFLSQRCQVHLFRCYMHLDECCRS